MEFLDNDYMPEREKETDFGIKQISCQDILFCILRILFGIFITYQCNLWLLFILLCMLCVCKVITLVVITQSSRILSKYVDDYSKHEVGIKTIDSLNKKTAFYTVVAPHILQFILCFYVAALLCIYSSKTEYSMTMWVIGISMCIINMVLLNSTLDIFVNEGFTIPLNKNISFDTQKNYWGEGIVIIFWSILYVICSVYCCFVSLDTFWAEGINYTMFAGMIIFIASVIQTIKCLNLPDIYKTCFGNIRFYDYLSYQKALLNCREQYISCEWKKIFALTISISVLVISVSFMGIILNRENMATVDEMTTIICIIALSLTSTIFILRRMCKVPLLKGLFEEEYPEYFSEYIDLSNNIPTFYLNHQNTHEK